MVTGNGVRMLPSRSWEQLLGLGIGDLGMLGLGTVGDADYERSTVDDWSEKIDIPVLISCRLKSERSR